MRNIIHQIVTALDGSKRLRLDAITYDGLVVRFITSDESGIPLLSRPTELTEEWFEKNGLR